jgi:hypothetical protein
MPFEEKKQPKVFANRVIQQVVDHMLLPGTEITPNDFMLIRVVFRSAGGSWASFADGDTAHAEILKSVIKSWGLQSPKQKVLV